VKKPEFVTVDEFEVESEATAMRAQRKNLPESVRVEAINRHGGYITRAVDDLQRALPAANRPKFSFFSRSVFDQGGTTPTLESIAAEKAEEDEGEP
jgi:hypothetical protein